GWPPGGRPPWWPETETWPPDRGAWRRVAWQYRRRGGPYGPMGPWSSDRRHRFGRQIGCFVVLFALVFGSIGVLLLWALGSLLGLVPSAAGSDSLVRTAVLVLVVLAIVGIAGGIRFAQRISAPLTDLVDAAGRVEAGDYSVRVVERRRGPVELQGLL